MLIVHNVIQAVVTEYRLLQPDNFWTKYTSQPGQLLSFSDISRRINWDNQERDCMDGSGD
jgi:hypothetical protein